jgi:cell pole-organizing protein PopZ
MPVTTIVQSIPIARGVETEGRSGDPMSQTYAQRVATVEGALADRKVTPAAGETLADVAAKVLYALDHVPEKLR